jgi:hypothetical protein
MLNFIIPDTPMLGRFVFEDGEGGMQTEESADGELSFNNCRDSDSFASSCRPSDGILAVGFLQTTPEAPRRLQLHYFRRETRQAGGAELRNRHPLAEM